MAVLINKISYEKKASREKPIKIFLNGKPIAVSQGTPENLSELAVGFLLAEGLISDRRKFRDTKEDCDKTYVDVRTDEQSTEDKAPLYRVTSSGCSQAALLNDMEVKPVVEGQHPVVFKADDLLAMMEQLCQKSPKRNDGECVHGCGIGNRGELVCVREDVGRHNAMDKLIGQAWLESIVMHDMAMLTTGRISHEMTLKAVQSGVTTLVSHKGVTDSAIELAEELGITLVGKCRDNSMQVLTHHHRVM